MNDRRYYYTDALSAAWMAKHFGMRFDVFLRRAKLRVQKEIANWGDIARHSAEFDFHLHSLSVHLLEPQIGDLVECVELGPNRANVITNPSRLTLVKDYQRVRVVQRGGRSFIWPETEAAESPAA